MYIFNLIIRGSSLTGVISSKNGFFKARIGVRVKGYFQLSKWYHFFLLFFLYFRSNIGLFPAFLRMADLEWKNWWLVSNVASTFLKNKKRYLVYIKSISDQNLMVQTEWADRPGPSLRPTKRLDINNNWLSDFTDV